MSEVHMKVRSFRSKQAKFRAREKDAEVSRDNVYLGRPKGVYDCLLEWMAQAERLDCGRVKVCRWVLPQRKAGIV